MTEETFVLQTIEWEENLQAENPELVFEVHPKAIMVDISGRDVTHFDNVDKALGLTRSNELTYESICAKVKPIDEARDKVTMASGFQEAYTELLAKAGAFGSTDIEEEGEDEKKVEEMKKRRSTIVQCELLIRDPSARSINNAESEKVQMRRKSLIKTGKIED